jgi:membrane protease YdiL (CAAX protease family)
VSEPSFDLPDAEELSDGSPTRPAPITGWIVLFLIVGMLVGVQLYGYLTRKPSSEREFSNLTTQYRAAVLQKEASRRFPLLSLGSGEVEKTSNKTIDDLISEVAPVRRKNPAAARLYVSMRHEIGQEFKPEDLEPLSDSKKPEDRTFARIYSEEKLEADEAEKLGLALPKTNFANVMAGVHAREKAGLREARRKAFPDSEILKPMVALGLVMAGLFVGGFVLVTYIVFRMAGRMRPEGHPAGVLNAEQAESFAGRTALVLIAYIASGVFAALAFRPVLTPQATSLIAGLLTASFALFALKPLGVAGGPSVRILGFDRRRLLGDIGWGIGAFMANIPLVFCCALATQNLFSGLPPAEHPISNDLQRNLGVPEMAMILIAASLLAPVFEEICFRGMMTPAMEKLFGGPGMGIFASSLIFAAIHPTGIPAWPALAMIGAMAAYITYQRGSLIPAIVFHGVHNGALLILSTLLF